MITIIVKMRMSILIHKARIPKSIQKVRDHTMMNLTVNSLKIIEELGIKVEGKGIKEVDLDRGKTRMQLKPILKVIESSKLTCICMVISILVRDKRNNLLKMICFKDRCCNSNSF